MSMDSEEFYKEDDLKEALKVMVENDYDSSACQLQTYWKNGEWILNPPEEYYVSLIYKIRSGVDFVLGHVFPVLVDPTRRMKPGNCKIFSRDEIEMHHMSYVRKDIAKKLFNSSSRYNFGDEDLVDVINFYNNWDGENKIKIFCPNVEMKDIIKVENLFKI
jgi:hypothetical protein